MKNPRISVIMSAYNSEKYLAEAIESILNQTFKDFEFIIINDGSTDNSLKIIRKYQKKDKRIKIMNNKNNLGLIKSLNKGLKIAKGKYIARMDADDISLPERFETQYGFLEKNNDIFLCGSGAIIIDKNGKEIALEKVPLYSEEIDKRLKKSNCLIHPSIMFRNEKKFFYREKAYYCEDYDLYLQMISQRRKIVNCPLPLLKYRITPDSISSTKTYYQKLFVKKIRDMHAKGIKKGREEYNLFDAEKVLSANPKSKIEKACFQREIELKFRFNQMSEVRISIKNYFKNYGCCNKMMTYYLASYISPLILNKLRRFIWKKID